MPAVEQVQRQALRKPSRPGFRRPLPTIGRSARRTRLRRRRARGSCRDHRSLIVVVALHWFWRRLDRLLVRRLQTRIHDGRNPVVRAAARRAHLERRCAASFRGDPQAIVYLVDRSDLSRARCSRRFRGRAARRSSMVEFALGPVKIIGGGILANIPSLVFLPRAVRDGSPAAAARSTCSSTPWLAAR